MAYLRILLLLAGPAVYVYLFFRSAAFRRLAKWFAWLPALVVGITVGVANWRDSPLVAVCLGSLMAIGVWGGLYWQFGRIKSLLLMTDRMIVKYRPAHPTPTQERLERRYRRAAARARERIR